MATSARRFTDTPRTTVRRKIVRKWLAANVCDLSQRLLRTVHRQGFGGSYGDLVQMLLKNPPSLLVGIRALTSLSTWMHQGESCADGRVPSRLNDLQPKPS